jgi:catechol 2,3-dioxygenase-like lactoylglutathione lyase family enzyme
MAKKGLSHIALKVRDLKKTEDFYVDVLGLKVAFRHPPSMIFLTTPGSGDLLNFVKTTQHPRANQGLEHLGFKVTAAELKKLEAKFKKAGIEIDGRRAKLLYITDPNGYRWNTTATKSIFNYLFSSDLTSPSRERTRQVKIRVHINSGAKSPKSSSPPA